MPDTDDAKQQPQQREPERSRKMQRGAARAKRPTDRQGIVLDDKAQEQPADGKRASSTSQSD